jgi:hypothetical protein
MTMKSDVKERCWLCSEVEMRVEAACIFFGSQNYKPQIPKFYQF